eukprot:Opistho-2@25419
MHCDSGCGYDCGQIVESPHALRFCCDCAGTQPWTSAGSSKGFVRHFGYGCDCDCDCGYDCGFRCGWCGDCGDHGHGHVRDPGHCGHGPCHATCPGRRTCAGQSDRGPCPSTCRGHYAHAPSRRDCHGGHGGDHVHVREGGPFPFPSPSLSPFPSPSRARVHESRHAYAVYRGHHTHENLSDTRPSSRACQSGRRNVIRDALQRVRHRDALAAVTDYARVRRGAECRATLQAQTQWLPPIPALSWNPLPQEHCFQLRYQTGLIRKAVLGHPTPFLRVLPPSQQQPRQGPLEFRPHRRPSEHCRQRHPAAAPQVQQGRGLQPSLQT